MDYKIEYQKTYQDESKILTVYVIVYNNIPFALTCTVNPNQSDGTTQYEWIYDVYYLRLYNQDITVNQAFEALISTGFIDDEYHWNHLLNI